MIKNIYTIAFLVFFSLSINAQVKLYVSPTGNDLNSGTKEQPLASLIGARNAIRNHKKDAKQSSSFIVTIADGFYTMKESFILTHEDSGTLDSPIIYKAEKGASPVFSGGKK